MSQWLRDGALKPYLQLLQTGDLFLIRDGHLDKESVSQTSARFLKGRAHYLTVWSIIALEGWYRNMRHYDQLNATK